MLGNMSRNIDKIDICNVLNVIFSLHSSIVIAITIDLCENCIFFYDNSRLISSSKFKFINILIKKQLN